MILRQVGATQPGPAATRISEDARRHIGRLGPLPAMIADRARLRTMLASLARTLHVGCWPTASSIPALPPA
ncbi:hypothetical protein SS05631_a49150 (plasmid) [Sinorhizobium sp. CCBAU 05631]|nr:hypothetical protein SS05631_a49150 [Sinorhizobium sp. CCBAU 05631]